MTRVYFVRHAQPEFSHEDDRTRPLTAEGMADAKIVAETLKDKEINVFYCSPYKRSIDTIAETADYYGMTIQADERLREREHGINSNNYGMFQKRWADHDFHEEGGESINMVQTRNVEALKEILDQYDGKNIVIGTHGTALSTILNYYNPEFGCDDFLRIIDWMPYIVELDFDRQKLIGMTEHAHIEKVFHGTARADKKILSGIDIEQGHSLHVTGKAGSGGERMHFISKQLIRKGWSGDKKYCVEQFANVTRSIQKDFVRLIEANGGHIKRYESFEAFERAGL